MSMRRPAGFISAFYNPLKNPNAPTIGTASVASGTSVSITFTAPTNVGGSAIAGYIATAKKTSDGTMVSATGSSSPITITGLTTDAAYTVTVAAVNSYGPSASSAASGSVIPTVQGQQAYTTAGTYSWVAPAGVTSISVVAVGGGAGVQNTPHYGKGGGGLGYKNNYSVTPGSSYTVVVGAGNVNTSGNDSYFVSTAVVKGGGAFNFTGGTYTGDGGGNGGNGNDNQRGSGGGAGGYSGNGGGDAAAGSGGGGGGGGGAGGGGGVGLLGQGSNGAGGNPNGGPYSVGGGGGGGSSGANGSDGSTTGSPNFYSFGGSGGLYGGGGGGYGSYSLDGGGANGAVRIIWPGTTRSFPSTNTGNL